MSELDGVLIVCLGVLLWWSSGMIAGFIGAIVAWWWNP
jgi:hypothetical protein